LTSLMHDELRVLEDIEHPNILRIYELLHDDSFYFIVSEFLRYGEMYDYIVERAKHADVGAMSESEVRHVAFQLFYALKYMHEKKIMHRDIKPENILIESVEDLQIKLADFGFATYFKQEK
jgi:serine/threonine protein kinase